MDTQFLEAVGFAKTPRIFRYMFATVFVSNY